MRVNKIFLIIIISITLVIIGIGVKVYFLISTKEAILYFSPSFVEAKNHQDFPIDLIAETKVPTYGVDISIKFDSNLLRILEVKEGSNFGSKIITQKGGDVFSFSILLPPGKTVRGKIKIATLKLTPLGPGRSIIRFLPEETRIAKKGGEEMSLKLKEAKIVIK